MLVCTQVAFHTERLQIALTEINLLSCTAIRHGFGRVRNAAKEEPKGEEEQMSWKFATFDLWQQRTITITNRSRSPHIAEHNVNLLPWSSQSPNLEACLGHYGEKTEEFPASSGNAASSSARKNQPSARIDDSTRGGVCIHPGETNPLLKKCLYINLMNCYLFIVKRSC